MRKKFTMLLAALFLVMGSAWAQTTYTVSATTGTGVSSGWTKNWAYTTSEANPAALKLTCNYNNMTANDGHLQLMKGDHGGVYTLSVPSAYKIVSYSFDFVKVGTDWESSAVTLTVGDKTYNPTEEVQSVSVSDVNSSSTQFTITGTANKGFKATNFKVVVDYAFDARFSKPGTRKSSFAVGDEVYIYSTCRVNGNGSDFTGFLTNKNNSTTLTKAKPSSFLTTDNNSIWVVASVEELTTESKPYFKITLKNKATNGFFGIGGVTSNATAGEPQTLYVSQWNNVVLTGDAEKAGNDVWSENEDGTALNPTNIANDAPIFAVQAGNGKCMNTNNSSYNANRVAYPIVFYTVADANAAVATNLSGLNDALAPAETLLSECGFSAIPLQVTNETAAGYIKCSNIDTEEGKNMDWLIDNDPNTFIHSNWHSVSSSNDYLEVYLGEGNGVSLFYFTEISRIGVTNDYPKSVEILGSTDGQTYTSIKTVDGLPQTGGTYYQSPLIECNPSYVYLRFVVTTGNDRIYFHMAEFDIYTEEVNNANVNRGRIEIYRALNEAVAEAKVNKERMHVNTFDGLTENILAYTERINRVYPFTLTTDNENPALYAIKSGRTNLDKGWWYTYDESDGKIGLTQFTLEDKQFWYFKEVVKNKNLYLELYPYVGGGSAMSYTGTGNAAGNVMIASKQTGNCSTLWQWEESNGKYGLQTENKENRLSNNGGVVDGAGNLTNNKMGMWNDSPSADAGSAMYLFASPQYPFTVTTDDTNPELYAIKSGRDDEGKEWWYTYDKTDGKIALSPYTGAQEQLWFFKEVASDKYAYGLQLYPAADASKAMSYQNTDNGAAKIVAQSVGTSGYTSTWILETTNGTQPYGLQTAGKENRLSNNGGYTNKLGMWNASPSGDAGSAMYFAEPEEILQALIDEAEEDLTEKVAGSTIGYYTEVSVTSLQTAVETAKENLNNKVYTVTDLKNAIASVELILPQAGKYYQIKSAKPEFLEKQGKEMALYSKGAGNLLSWKALDGTDKSFYWTITPNAEGTSFVLKNVGDGTYIPAVANEKYTMTAEETSAHGFTLSLLTAGQFNITGSGTMHMLGHSNGDGTGGDICTYSGGANTPSAWTIVEVDHPDLATAKAGLQARVDELNAIVANMGTIIGQYKETDKEALQGHIVTAQNVLDGGSPTPDDYTEALGVLNEAISSLDYSMVLPTTGKYYQLHSSWTSFGDDARAVYSADGNVRWTVLNDADRSFYWVAEAAAEGEEGFVLKNYANNKYILGKSDNNTVWTLQDDKANAAMSVKIMSNAASEKGFEYAIIWGNRHMHTADHGEGSGTEGRIVSWETNAANSGSSWYLVEIADPEWSIAKAELKAIVSEAWTYMPYIGNSDAPGYYTSSMDDVATRFEVINTWSKNDVESATTEQIKAKTAETREIINSFSMNLPKIGKFYRFSYDYGGEIGEKYVQAIASNAVNPDNANQGKQNAMSMVGGEQGAASIFYYDGGANAESIDDDKLLSYSTGLYVRENDDVRGLQAVGAQAGQARFAAGSEVGKLYIYADHSFHANNQWNSLFVDHCANPHADEHNFIVEEVTTLPVTIGEVGYVTFYTPVAVTVPTDVTASIISEITGNDVVLTQVTGIVPAGVGLILQAEQAGTYDFTIATENIPTEFAKGLLLGAAPKALIKGEENTSYYVLANKNGKVGLYKAKLNKDENGADGTTHFLNGANKVYLPLTVGENLAPAMFSFERDGEGGTTSIDNSEIVNQNSEMIFDLAGRRVLNPTKGIYIVNGKKVVIK